MIVEYVDLYLLLHRGIKINNVELYSFALYELTPIFFQTNHLNYARWMTYHSIELTNVKDDRPEIHKMLTGGAFSINRKGNPFTQVGVDMGLEQTINADAKNRLKGIMPYADISSAVNRWMVTGAMRAEIINELLEVADMKNTDAGNKDLNQPRMEKDKKRPR